MISQLDEAAIAGLKPERIASYLEQHGWRKSGVFADRAEYWAKQDSDGEENEVILPSKRSFRNYVPKIRQLLRVVAIVERRTSEQVLRDFQPSVMSRVHTDLRERYGAPSSMGELLFGSEKS